MHATRCSGSGAPASSTAPKTCGNRLRAIDGSKSRSRVAPPAPAPARLASVFPARQRSSSQPSARGFTAERGSSAAVAALTAISPALAALSVSTVVETAGPSTTSSRCDEPTRKNKISPEWTPTDIERRSGPTEVGISAARRRELRISTAAEQARTAWPSPRKNNSSASPPNLSNMPPRSAAMSSIAPNTRLSVSTSSSPPERPRCASRSASAVKPEMSANTSVPSIACQRRSGESTIHSRASSGTCLRRPNDISHASIAERCTRGGALHRRAAAIPRLTRTTAAGQSRCWPLRTPCELLRSARAEEHAKWRAKRISVSAARG